jgi:hypothetical protein
VSGASGKPQAFGFAAFESPEVVMRAIRCLNGLELPDITPEGKAAGKPPKALVVKVDEKTREFLDEFEATLGRSDVSPIIMMRMKESRLMIGRRERRFIMSKSSSTYRSTSYRPKRPPSSRIRCRTSSTTSRRIRSTTPPRSQRRRFTRRTEGSGPGSNCCFQRSISKEG